MYSSTFIFHPTDYDQEFHRRNDRIAARARAIPGFLGEEEWSNEKTGLHSEVYYWETLDALHQLIEMGEHREAKARHARWIDSYRVVISQVLTSYGHDGLGLDHVPNGAEEPEDRPRGSTAVGNPSASS